MDIREMHYDFDVKIDKVASSGKANFTRPEKDWLLNRATEMFLKQRYGLTNPHRTGFEGTQKRTDDLKSLVIKFPNQPGLATTIHDGNIHEVALNQLAHPYWFLVRGTAEIIFTDCVQKASLKFIQHDDLNYALMDPFNRSSREEILFNFGRSSIDPTIDSIYLYPGDIEIGKVFLEYIKQPAKLNFGGYVYIDGVTYPQQNSDLSEHTHSEIVDIAVQLAAGIIEDPNYTQLKTQQVFIHE
jgi:hypothetical protein